MGLWTGVDLQQTPPITITTTTPLGCGRPPPKPETEIAGSPEALGLQGVGGEENERKNKDPHQTTLDALGGPEGDTPQTVPFPRTVKQTAGGAQPTTPVKKGRRETFQKT
ncbi:unnamed protein product [Lota lota]